MRHKLIASVSDALVETLARGLKSNADQDRCSLCCLVFILYSEWIHGVKVSSIDVSTPDGRSRLATLQATLLNSYLTQLLESGFLHAGEKDTTSNVADSAHLQHTHTAHALHRTAAECQTSFSCTPSA